MKTIRRFGNIAEAGFAQSLLEAAGIEATLADEATGALGPQFVPWGSRLDVPDADVERALKILNREVGLDPGVPAPGASVNEDSLLLTELRKLRTTTQTAFVWAILLLIAATFYLASQLRPSSPARPASQVDSWQTVETAMDRFDYDRATEIIQRILGKYPKDYYGYVYLARIALATGHPKEAEADCTKACAMFPDEQNEKMLQAIQKRLASESSKNPAAAK